MADQWFYLSSGQQKGPISAAALKQLVASGALSASDLVWQHGLSEWVPAAKIKGLFPQVAVDPPVAPPVASSAQPSTPIPAPKPLRPSEASRLRSTARGRLRTATSWLDLFDWKFQKYLTPWIVRTTWIISIVLSALWIVAILFGMLKSFIPQAKAADSRSAMEILQDSDFQIPELGRSRTSLFPKWLSSGVVRFLVGITLICLAIITTLWIRVVLEMAIVFFNIANTLTSIEQKIEPAKL